MADDIATLRRILRTSRTIAVVGLSAEWHRPSFFAAKYMQEHGYRIVPVNPRYDEILGERCHPTLATIAVRSTSSTCFRRSEDVMPIAEQAIAIGAKCLWQQIGVRNEAAAALAAERRPRRGHGPLRQDRARAPVRRPRLGGRRTPA